MLPLGIQLSVVALLALHADSLGSLEALSVSRALGKRAARPSGECVSECVCARLPLLRVYLEACLMIVVSCIWVQ